MSGIYIPGMEMPKTCCYCPLMGYDPDREWFDSMARTGAHICALTGELIDNTKRAEHCPLIPVPEHGRLIDADARVNVQMYNDEFEDYQTVNMSIDDLLDSSWIELEDDPTIIPAEEGCVGVFRVRERRTRLRD